MSCGAWPTLSIIFPALFPNEAATDLDAMFIRHSRGLEPPARISPCPTVCNATTAPGYLHFITSSCYRRRTLLATSRRRDLFLKVLEQGRRAYGLIKDCR